MNNEALRIENLHLSYKGLAGTTFSKPSALAYFDKSSDIDKELICGANLVLNRGETLCIGGPSGQGKSALLRVIAGLARPSEGKLYYFGEHIPAERQTALEIAKRQVGLVFQNGALISNLRVRDNIALPLRYHKVGTPKEIEDKINMAMDLMRVRDCAMMFPHQLDDDLGAGREEFGHLAGFGLLLAGAVGGDAFLGFEAGGVLGNHVPVVDEGVLLHADVDEGGLEAVLEVLDAALVDGAHQPFVRGMLHLELLEVAVFDDGDASLKLFGVDDDLALDLLLSKQPAQYRHEL